MSPASASTETVSASCPLARAVTTGSALTSDESKVRPFDSRTIRSSATCSSAPMPIRPADQSNREGFPRRRGLLRSPNARAGGAQRAGASSLRGTPSRKSQLEKKGGLFERFDLGEIRAALAANYLGDSRLIGLIDDKNRDIQEGVVEVQQVLSRYSRLATLGSLVDRILHDGRTVVTRLKNISRFGKRDLGKTTLSAVEKIAIAQKSMGETADQADILAALFNQSSPSAGASGTSKGSTDSRADREGDLDHAVEADDRGVSLAAGDADISNLGSMRRRHCSCSSI